MPNVLVSVIMAVYNSEKYLRKALDTVLNQTYRDIELICIDDGSDDDSLKILKEYNACDKRMKIIVQNNQYAGVARNKGMLIAKGKYIIFLDADDFFQSDMIEKSVKRAEETDAQIVIFNAAIFDEKKQTEVSNDWILNQRLAPDKNIFSAKDCPDDVFNISTTAAWNKLYERKYIEEQGLYFQNISHINDLLFTTSAISVAEKITVLNEKLITYRVGNQTSLQGRKNKRILDFVDAFKGLYQFLNNKNIWETYRRSYIKLCFNNIIGYLNQQNNSETYEQFYRLVKSELMPLTEKDDVYIFNNEYFSERFLYLRDKTVNEYLYFEYKYEKERDVCLCQTICDLENDIDNLRNLESIVEKKIWRFPSEIFPAGSKIIVYGAGDVGKDFYYQLKMNKHLIVTGWVDRNYIKIRKRYKEVEAPESINEKDYDYIIIAVIDKSISCSIQRGLLKMGIPKEKIKFYEE